MEAIRKRVAGIDVHRMKHVITSTIENEDGTEAKHTRKFGGFKRDLKEPVAWLLSFKVELAILESTGIYWKSVFAHLRGRGHPVRNTPCIMKSG